MTLAELRRKGTRPATAIGWASSRQYSMAAAHGLPACLSATEVSAGVAVAVTAALGSQHVDPKELRAQSHCISVVCVCVGGTMLGGRQGSWLPACACSMGCASTATACSCLYLGASCFLCFSGSASVLLVAKVGW